MGTTVPGHHPDRLASVLERALETGVITPAQAVEIAALDAGGPPGPGSGKVRRRVPPALEVLGYLGAVFVIVGAVSLVAGFWDDLPAWARLAILGATAAALTGAGLSVGDDDDPVRWRLRGMVLLLGSFALAGFAALLAVDALKFPDAPATLLAGGAVGVHSGLLWARRDRPAQHLACLAGLATAAGGAVDWAGGGPGAVGLTLWAGGACWLLASGRRLLPPVAVGTVLGAGLMLVGAGVSSDEWTHAGVAYGLATSGALVAAGVRTDAFLVTAVGVVGCLVFLPGVLTVYFGSRIGPPAVMLASGFALLGLTVILLQQRARSGAPAPDNALPR